MKLVSLDQAKAWLRIDDADTAGDVELAGIVIAASRRVLRHIDTEQDFLDTYGEPTLDTDGLAEDIPEDVQIGTLMLAAAMWRDREGDGEAWKDPGFLPPAVTTMLYPFRTPGFA